MPQQLEALTSEQEELLAQLRPIWQAAQELENPPPEAFAHAYALYRQNAALRVPTSRPQPRLLPSRRTPLYAFSVLAVAILLVLFIGAWATVIEQAQDVLPGQALYPVKTQVEQIRLVTTLSKASKAELCMTLAQTRVREVEALAAKGDLERIPETLAAFDDLVQKGSAYLEAAAGSEPVQVAAFAPELERILQESEITLTKIAPLAPNAQPALARALAASRQAEQALGAALITAEHNRPTPVGGAASPAGDNGTPVPSLATPGGLATAEPTPVPGILVNPTNTRKPDNTPQPTNTHKPSNTPQPTNTRKPSNTPHPTNTHQPKDNKKPGLSGTPGPQVPLKLPANYYLPTYLVHSAILDTPTKGGESYAVFAA